MKILFTETDDLFFIRLDYGNLNEEQLRLKLFNSGYSVDDVGYGDLWIDVCTNICHAWLFRFRYISIGDYTIYLEKYGLEWLVNKQRKYLDDIVFSVNLEMRRLDIMLQKKYGEQMSLVVE